MLPCLHRAVRPTLTLRSGTMFRGLRGTTKVRETFPTMLVQSCNLGTHPHKDPMEPLTSPQGARDFICNLQPTERTCLLRELHKFESIAIAQGTLEVLPPTSAQLKYIILHNAIPFVGFGFLDNAIMIVAGTQIELSIGVILGISTMAAAALGNLVSDLAGLGLAGYVEALACRLGMRIPDLSPKQVDMWQTRVSSHSGKALGVGIGCILGMFPLLFFKDDEKKKEKKEKKDAEASSVDITSST